MSIGLNASQARSNSKQDMLVFNEIVAIMRAVIDASDAGSFDVEISDGTTMTESTPISKLMGSVINPTVLYGSNIIINGNPIQLGASGTHLNAIISDINDANIAGISATKEDGKLVIYIEHAQQSTWSYEIGDGTANTNIGLTPGIYVTDTPDSIRYFSVWQGTETDRAIQRQMNEVLRFYTNLGYKIDRLANTVTNKTIKWYLYW